jgi:GAF domain-containing protein
MTVKNLLLDQRMSHKRFFQSQGFVSYLGIPLIAKGEILGVLSFYTREEHEFSETEIEFLSNLTRHAAIAIYNSQLYEKIKNQTTELLQTVVQLETTGHELAARVRELECLHQINQEILNSLDLKDILAKILSRAMSIGSFQLGVVRLWNPTKAVLEPVVREGFLHPERLQSYSAAFLAENQTTLVSRALVQRQTAVEENVQGCAGLTILRGEGAEVALAVPVIAHTEVLGVLLLGSRRPRRLDADLVHLIETIGNQLGLAVQKVRLQEETQHNLERVKGLHEIYRATTSTLEMSSVLDLLLEKIVSILPYSAAGIRLMNNHRGALEPVACRNIDPDAWKSVGKSKPGRLSGLVFATTEPLVIPNMLEDPRTAHLQLFRKEGLVSYLGLPLIAKGERIGVLSLYTRVRHDFTDDEIVYVSTLADQAAIAIQNSQLYEAARKLSRDLLASRSQIRTLMSGIVKAKDEEARRIARELHDESGQLLAAVHISLGEMANNLPVEFGHQIRQTKELLKQVETSFTRACWTTWASFPASNFWLNACPGVKE